MSSGRGERGHVGSQGLVRQRDSTANIGGTAASATVCVAVSDTAAIPPGVITVARDHRIPVSNFTSCASGVHEKGFPRRHGNRGLNPAAQTCGTSVCRSSTHAAVGINLQPGHTSRDRVGLRSAGVVKGGRLREHRGGAHDGGGKG